MEPESPRSWSASFVPETSRERIERLPRWWRIAVAGCLSVCLCAVLAANRSRGLMFPSLFVDAYGSFSAIDLPGLGTSRLPLRFPYELSAVDGAAVRCPETFPYRSLSCMSRMFERRRAGEVVMLRFDTPQARPIDVARPMTAIGTREIVSLFITYCAVGLFVLWSGNMVFAYTARGPFTYAYAAWTSSSALFFFSFFDYHTSGWLTPVFSLSTVAVELSFLWLAFSFPTPLHSRGIRIALLGLSCAGLALGAWLMIAPAVLQINPRNARIAVGALAMPCLSALPVTLIARMWRAEPAVRHELRSAAAGMALSPACMGVGFGLAATGIDVIHPFLPLLAVVMPLSIGYASLRRNVPSARTVVQRAVFELPAGALAISAGVVLWLELPGRRGFAHAAACAAAIWLALTRWLRPRLFPARTSFRPSMEALRDVLGQRKTASEVAEALAGVIELWLAVASVEVLRGEPLQEFSKSAPALDGSNDRADDLKGYVDRGRLVVPVRALGDMLAVILIGPKRTGAPFNQEDVDLLGTIAGFGGLALHHAYVLEELDRLRRADLDAAGQEKRATVAALGKEIAHELTYSVSYFRFFLMRARADAAISSDDIENAGDEIERLARMLAALRHFALPPAKIGCVAITGPIRQAQSLVREGLTEKAIRFDVEHREPLFVRADRDQLVQVLANLFRNAVQAVPEGGSIRVVCSAETGWVTIRVLDDGPGVPIELSERLFTPLLTGETRGLGVGLVVAAGMVRGWGGKLDHRRRDNLTDFFMVIPEATP